jgi:hypothetical protein
MKSLLIPAIVCMPLMLVSCMKKITPPEPEFVTVDKETSILKGEIGSKDTIYITSNTQWAFTFVTGVDWMT